ncbi:PAS domain-containing protein [Cohaesibacter gelatinilyticus]|uniref:PAS domain S-box-containing protein n=1 Tax=Cohaesibacter gelatinilyticus TaxID=372072 RepID=A0A285PJL2_9HYPH|nr:PAS domain-containing protein [Cohaesibacter gelatinilyticus]SNZ21608.1 PAS domain S-box-containing protein [Cohaesibacter gelatinilyticus]HAT86339.1 PAS domain S-box protein [Hyphomicrobiales bacterium]
MSTSLTPTGVERFFDEGEILVSKTDTRGRITYCNEIFRDIAGYDNADLLGEPHSCVRHPEMPRTVFKILWEALQAKREIFAYVKNLSSNGDHYWVFAHVTPSYDGNGDVVGFHSARRCPDRKVLNEVIEPLYRDLIRLETSENNRKNGLEKGFDYLTDLLKNKGLSYDQFILTL